MAIDNPLTHLFASESKKYSYALGVGLPGRVWQTKEVLYTADVKQLDDTVFERRPLALQTGITSAAAMPILSYDSEVFGVLCFFSRGLVSRQQLFDNSMMPM